MTKKTPVTRRQFFGTNAVIGTSIASMATRPLAASTELDQNEPGQVGPRALAQDYSVAVELPSPDHYMHDPGMARLDNGDIFVAAPCFEWRDKGVLRRTKDLRVIVSEQLLLSRSTDGGVTWEPLGSMPYRDATPFVHDGRLFMFIPALNPKRLLLTSSDDGGKTWADPVTLFEGRYWNCSTGMTVVNNQLYWALNQKHKVVVIAADLSGDLMNPKTWRMSTPAPFPEVPDSLTRKLYPPEAGKWPVQWAGDLWLEPNVVHVHGQIRVLLRAIIDEYATAGLCGVCDLQDNGQEMELNFTQFYPLPGGQNKFFILDDDVSGMFWMLSNLVTDSQDFQGNREKLIETGFQGGAGNERRFLMLFYSIDCLNWFPAGCVAQWPSLSQSFMYPSAAVDGDDMILISRTSKNGQNQHDADLVTFHRIKNFRSLALDLQPRFG